MRILFLLNNRWVDACFSPDDRSKLANNHVLIFSDRDDPSELHKVWNQHASSIDVVVTGWDTPPFTDEMLDQAPRLKALVHAAGSIQHLLPESFWERNIRVGTAREALAVGVAETTLGMMIAGLKGFFPSDRLTASGRWKIGANQLPGFEVRELYRVTVGIIGASMVGRHLMRLLRQFEVQVLVADPHVTFAEAGELGVELVELDDLMRRSEVVTLHAPLLPETRRMLTAEQFTLMRDNAIFINTARGAIVDEQALIAELQTGRIWAFLDVTDPEPPAADHPFRTLPNVVLTPHTAGAVSNGCLRLGHSVAAQIGDLCEGGTMRGEVAAQQMSILA